MDLLQERLTALETQRAEVANQDIDAYVEAKLQELAQRIRAEAEQAQAYDLKVLDIRISAFREAVELVNASRVEESEVVTQEEQQS